MNAPELEEMMALARAAQSGWSALTVRRRCDFVANIRETLAAECEPIADLIARECVKHPLDALSGDVLVTLEHFRYCEKNASEILQDKKISKPAIFFRSARFQTHFEPHGVVLIFAPSNYPLQLSMIPLITALVAGNAVVLKCSERTPETAALIARLCTSAGLPANLVQVSHAGPAEAEAFISAKPDFIFFTGSSRTGRQVAQQAATHHIPGIFELGGKDASIVFADCHMERAIEGIVYGAFSNAGRVCVGIKRAYIEASIYKEFVARLTERAATLRIGPVISSDFPCLAERDQASIRDQVQDALDRGAKLRWPRNKETLFDQPAILTDVSPEARLLQEECFGPVLCLAPFTDESEAIALANSTPFALSSSIWTRDRTKARRVSAQLNAGSCGVNDVIRVIANPYAPFGGNGLSGYGRYHGAEGLRAFSRIKSVMFLHTHRKCEISWFPFQSKTFFQLATLLRFRHGAGLWRKIARKWMPRKESPHLSTFSVQSMLPASKASSFKVSDKNKPVVSGTVSSRE